MHAEHILFTAATILKDCDKCVNLVMIPARTSKGGQATATKSQAGCIQKPPVSSLPMTNCLNSAATVPAPVPEPAR